MAFTMAISCGNDAFFPDPVPEVARLLREVADRLESGEDASSPLVLRDVNGNDVGRFYLPSAKVKL